MKVHEDIEMIKEREREKEREKEGMRQKKEKSLVELEFRIYKF